MSIPKAPTLEQTFKLEQMSADELVTMARKAETAERYDDMTKFMKVLVQKLIPQNVTADKKLDLTVDQRNLLSVAYKNVIGARRATWRTLNETYLVEEKVADAQKNWKVQLLGKYKKMVESELKEICKEVLDLLNNRLLKATAGKNDESEVFYLKMTGDYYRYLVEFDSDKANANNAAENYKKALEIAQKSLAPTHPIRLGLALNYSVCYYEILNEPEKACALAKAAFDDAIAKLDTLDEASYKDSTLIMQLLRDNLTLWTQPQQEGGAEGAEQPAQK